MNKERLLNVAKALRESPSPHMFTMVHYGHACGTPACALGHYAARTDLQDAFELTQSGFLVTTDAGDGRHRTLFKTLEHFGINNDQENNLFGLRGCAEARTPIEAAEYIERFVAEHE